MKQKKLKNVLKTTTFSNLQDLEKNSYFPEATRDLKGKKITFFKYGLKNNWKDFLTSENLNIINRVNLEQISKKIDF